MDDAVTMGSIGGVAILLAMIAWWADRRRLRRSDPDAVGFMPWTIYFLAMMIGCVALGLAARDWFHTA
jgi:hypothetical protein